jgi:hypothetical protein
MKTSLAIALAATVAAAVLVSGATESLMSGPASAQTLTQLWCTKGCPPPPKPAPTYRRGR